MKNASRISARRVLQGGAAFAALGALTLAAASPAHADTYGWGYASALGASSPTQTYITKDQTVSDSFSGAIGSWLTVEGTTTATVNSSGATGTAVVDTARIVITEADLPGILDPEDDSDEDEETPDEDEDSEDDEDADDEGDDDAPEGDDTPDAGDGEGDTDVPDHGGTDQPADEPTEQPTDQPSDEPADPAEDGDDDEDNENTTASADVIELDEENSELVDNGSEILLEATINGASVSTSQGWDGSVNHGFDAGVLGASTLQAQVEDETVELQVSLEPVSGVYETEDAGFVWNDAVTDMYITFSVGDEIVSGFLIAESAAGITTGSVDGGGDDGGDDDAKNPPVKERDADTVPKTEAKDAQPLAKTGSPIAGLIAAGAAIAAGGGAAAYLARRKKKSGEEAPETNEG
ncbi:LPXTG cell wall anchor domain-containing protein [Nocardiopsis sp. L17-MgMaSL7]|uniref:LPXTG cell wall anchor domain-containing protein n=1 Tax=Nocardiopsis sp. L17-MgMaSL7 TaxID=1938893 RepID=UPI000D88E761|nr:LPXTG cell wall anchor domain-containing protein [Nocardiopsis sp. L17-MgMaSL7]PWV45746.1 LPXTG-motif cell wall-anchored protein [Nocardiopsis sp. L17-MgMaSL7]